jgi:hypothetical protein
MANSTHLCVKYEDDQYKISNGAFHLISCDTSPSDCKNGDQCKADQNDGFNQIMTDSSFSYYSYPNSDNAISLKKDFSYCFYFYRTRTGADGKFKQQQQTNQIYFR